MKILLILIFSGWALVLLVACYVKRWVWLISFVVLYITGFGLMFCGIAGVCVVVAVLLTSCLILRWVGCGLI